MKHKPFAFLPDTPLNLLLRTTSRRNALLLLNLIGFTTVLIVIYAFLFHLIAEYEGMRHTWFTGIYWTFEIMSTLGTGDIVFRSVPGQIFTVIVLLTGIGFILIVIPFVFLQMFQSTARVPRELSRDFSNHVIITRLDEITQLLIEQLIRFNQPYCILCEDMDQAQFLIDEGYKVIHGNPMAPDTYADANIVKAALVTLTGDDEKNLALLHAIRLNNAQTSVIATSARRESSAILKEAGATHVLTAEKMLGETMARRVSGGDALAHLVGRMDNLLIAEATVTGTPLVGKTIRQANIREMTGLTVVGIWEKGHFHIARPDSTITAQSALVLAGNREQLQRYNEIFCIYNSISEAALIVGAGIVGRATARYLDSRRIPYTLIEADIQKNAAEHTVQGDARDPHLLKELGIDKAPSIVLTAKNDERNIYLTTLIRKINPRIQIIARAIHDQATQLLHRAGADFVISYATIGATTIFNYLKSGNILMVTEGVDVFRVKTPKALHGLSIGETTIRKDFGLTIIGMETDRGFEINPSARARLTAGRKIILIGTVESERKFLDKYLLNK